MAEGVFRSLAKSHPRIGEIDSCGTGAYHTLDPPDYRTMSTLEKNEIRDYDHGARQVTKEDFGHFDYMFAMDTGNLRDLEKMQRRLERNDKSTRAKVMLFGEFAGKDATGKTIVEEVIDPYYGADNGFDVVYEQVKRLSQNFLQQVTNMSGLVETK